MERIRVNDFSEVRIGEKINISISAHVISATGEKIPYTKERVVDKDKIYQAKINLINACLFDCFDIMTKWTEQDTKSITVNYENRLDKD